MNKPGNHMSMGRFSIITNTIRRAEELVFKSLRASLAQGPDVQVVLVDQNARPIRLPSELASDVRLKHQQKVVPGVASARNFASYSEDTEWLIFCDDDGYLATDYLRRLKELIAQSGEVQIFAGVIRRIDTGEFYSRRHAIGGKLNSFWSTKLLMGSNFVIRRTTFERLGKFDEAFGAGAFNGSSEETDLAWSAYFSGVTMRFAPELVVHHIPPFADSAQAEHKKAFRYGVGKGRLVRKWLSPRRPVVLVELLEMFVLPPLLSVASLLVGRGTEASIRLAGWLGRWVGLLFRGVRA